MHAAARLCRKPRTGTLFRFRRCCAMPRYFFHIENGHRISGDEGVEFPDDKTALKEAQDIADDRGRAKEPVRWVADEDIGWGQRQVAAQKRSKTDV
jgi:hypothetical protein